MTVGGPLVDPRFASRREGRRGHAVVWVALLFLAPFLAGCLGSGDEDSAGASPGDGSLDGDGSGDTTQEQEGDGETGSGDADGDNSTDDGGSSDNGTGDGDDGSGDDGGDGSSDNETGDGDDGSGDGGSGEGSGGSGEDNETSPGPTDPWAGDDPPWPELSDAEIRPGVPVKVGASFCTSNFLFRSLDDGALYLGLAAHCVQDAPSSMRAEVYGVDGDLAVRGEVAYSSWAAIGFDPGDPVAGDDVHPHDFALVRLPDEERALAHPAVLHYGGPVAMADWDEVQPADFVLAYGNSPSRPEDTFSPQEGYVLDKFQSTQSGKQGHSVLTHMVAPPIPGDSGSGLMTADGEALGVLSSITAGTPYGAWWEYASLPHALDHLNNQNGWDLKLATWDQMEPGLLP